MKHIRELMIRIKKLDAGIEARVLRQTTHVVIECRYQGVARNIVVGKTPSVAYEAIDNALKDINRRLIRPQALKQQSQLISR